MGSDRKSMEKKNRKRSSSSDSEEEGGRKRRKSEAEEKKSRKSDKKEKVRDKDKKTSHKRSKRRSDKEKKSMDKHKSKHRKGDLRSIMFLCNSNIKHDFQELSSDDYFLKNNEFATWLKEEKSVFFSDLPSESAHEMFADFVKAWNDQTLQSKYYEGIVTGPRSAHKWKIKE